MDSRRLRTGRGATPQFVKPLLNTLDSMRGQARILPDQLNARAQDLLWSAFGAEGGRGETSYAHGSLDVVAEHTRYFDGFALMMPLHAGCSVCIRKAAGPSRIVSRILGTDGEEMGPSESLEADVRQALASIVGESPAMEAAVVTSIPARIGAAPGATAQVATARAVSSMLSRTTSVQDDLARMWEDRGADRFIHVARTLAATVTDVPAFVLADTGEREFVTLDVPQLERPGLAVVLPPGADAVPDRQPKRKLLEEAIGQLRAGTFPQLSSVRDIEHRDLGRASSEVGRRHRPLLNYLVTENGRVQKLVTAIQKRDWQMLGALLMMSHASKSSDMDLAEDACDHVVKEVENMSLDGMYGASRLTADDRAVLVAGQPFVVPPALDRVASSFEERFGEPPTTLLL